MNDAESRMRENQPHVRFDTGPLTRGPELARLDEYGRQRPQHGPSAEALARAVELLAWPATVPAERATDALEVARGSSGGGGGRQHDVAVSERIADEPSPAQRWFALARRAPMARSGLRESGNGQGSRIAVARRASRFVHNPPPTKRRVRLHS